MAEINFDNIRPYTEVEAREAILRITEQHEFKTILNYIFEVEQHEELTRKAHNAKTIHEFQYEFMKPLVKKILSNTSKGVSDSGFEKLTPDKPRLFIANHRDITLDSSILATLLVEHNYESCEFTWGDNLMVSPFVEDFGKINRMITVFREGTPRQTLLNSKKLSAYIRKRIYLDKKAAWIAQSKGRTKNGNDKTDIGVLKMLTLDGKENLFEKIEMLNITPVSISFEWEPCDTLKTKELFISTKTKYVKDKKEDLNSIIGGILGQKGHIHLSICNPINEKVKTWDPELPNKDFFQNLAAVIDEEIYENYKLWPSNFLAYDLLNKSHDFSDRYNKETQEILDEHLRKTFEGIEYQEDEKELVEQLFLSIYANPVVNKLKYNFPPDRP
ncbi:MAG: hypothetical protein IH595_06730 [Bacteroidales bacterium]|nr:hypothetical protein [Bacteroidales bacterium]